MALSAEVVARSPTVTSAREYYRPILDIGPAGRYWVEDFLQGWITQGLAFNERSLDVHDNLEGHGGICPRVANLATASTVVLVIYRIFSHRFNGLRKEAAEVLGKGEYEG